MKPDKIPDNSIRRLAGYYRAIEELEAAGVDFISSRQLGELLGCTPSQVRQDLSFFGKYGLQGFGYAVGLLYHDLVHIFGADRHFPAIVLGAGNIGTELLETRALQNCGYEVIAAFDVSPELIGREIGGVHVYDAAEIESFLRQTPAVMAVLCVPDEAAAEAAKLVFSLGVKGIWNVSCHDLVLPWGAVTENLRLADSLMALGYRLKERMSLREQAAGE